MRLVNEQFNLVYETSKPVFLLVTSKQCFLCDRLKEFLPRMELKFAWVDFFELCDDMSKDEDPIVAKLNINAFPTIFLIDKSKGQNTAYWSIFKMEGERTEENLIEKIKACFSAYCK